MWMIAATPPPGFDATSSLWIWWIVGFVTLIGAGLSAVRWLRGQGADAARLEARLAAIEKALRPNGLNTNEIGDVVARTEAKLDALDSKLDRHIGAQEEVNRQVDQKLRRLARERE